MRTSISIDGEMFSLSGLQSRLREVKNNQIGLLTGKEYQMARCALSRRVVLEDGCNPPIRVGIHPQWGGRCLQYQKSSGEWEPFSLKKAGLTPEAVKHRDITEAFRREIHHQILEFKIRELSKPENHHLAELYRQDCNLVHVDHVIYFCWLLDEFCSIHNVELWDVEIIRCQDRSGHEIADAYLAHAWQEFHREHAILRLLTREEHQKRANP